METLPPYMFIRVHQWNHLSLVLSILLIHSAPDKVHISKFDFKRSISDLRWWRAHGGHWNTFPDRTTQKDPWQEEGEPRKLLLGKVVRSCWAGRLFRVRLGPGVQILRKQEHKTPVIGIQYFDTVFCMAFIIKWKCVWWGEANIGCKIQVFKEVIKCQPGFR